MEKLTEVLAMGGYGSFIWPAFAFAAAVIIFMAVSSLRNLSKVQRQLSDLQQ